MRKLTPILLALSLASGISAVHAQDMPRHKKPVPQEQEQQQQQQQETGKLKGQHGKSFLGQSQKKPRYEVRKGGRIPSPDGYAELRDYRKRGLKAPRKDQRWVLHDGQYLLISPKTGLILSIVPARR